MKFKLFGRYSKKEKSARSPYADFQEGKKIKTTAHRTYNSKIDLSLKKIESHGTTKDL